VYLVVGGALVIAGCLGMWLAAVLSVGPEDLTLLQSVLFSTGFFMPLIVVLAAAQATVSVWHIIEHHRFAKIGVRLSGLQINWLRVIPIKRGHEAAVRELRTMYPKIGPMHADTVIENLHRTQTEPR
jgi:hypothetical protein